MGLLNSMQDVPNALQKRNHLREGDGGAIWGRSNPSRCLRKEQKEVVGEGDKRRGTADCNGCYEVHEHAGTHAGVLHTRGFVCMPFCCGT
ncbi:hypothetical protein CDAR_27711 [Caerostris darwini]|uniref:Uncharacterized protein n=1 Tax=Caerostris darwini TaxID=1538125 RepID=A0AAV4SQL6_9ARAC|nr:hypothetical protein CDAR_27711 [Caerostris darwini]